MLTTRYDRKSVDSSNGSPRVVRIMLCKNHGGYLTFAGECSCSSHYDYEKYAVVGTAYGWMHDSGGNIRLWNSESGARHALKAYVGEPEAKPVLISVALKEGLKVYSRISFMCNTISDLYPREEAKIIERAISDELGECFTLDTLLNESCQEYRHLRALADGRWRDPELHAMRVSWWEALIKRLEAQGK